MNCTDGIFGKRRVDPINAYTSVPRPSPVMVWTPAHTRLFLEEAQRHRLFALYRLITLRGLRRGEVCGLRWKEVNLDGHTLTVNWQLVQLARQVHEGTPKTDASVRTIALDTDTAQILRTHRQQQLQERLTMGQAWTDTGFVSARRQPPASAARLRPIPLARLPGRATAHPFA
ncbi:hypothetical protein [Nonomuraea sp. B19D2]|uniref:hypothetical protein n=1 Tax=Nonomuraea sp. B19D2 TaxID=3159561 RepID=UPI0032DBC883